MYVTLVGVTDNANDALSMAAPLGQPLPLILVVKEPLPGYQSGELRTLPFTSGEQPPAIATARLRTDGSSAAREFATVALDKPAQIPFSLEFDRLRPGKTYTGRLFLTSSGLTPHRWTITVTTGGFGVVAVAPIGPLKFVTFPPFTSIGPFAGTGSFSFTLFDKSDSGPYSRVRARFEPSAQANSKSIASNFNLDTLSFWDGDKPVDLAQRGQGGNGYVTLPSARTFTARIASLAAGEYAGALRFAAEGTADDAADAKLPLLIQVRHHWVLPVLVIVLGSVIGWFTSKYVVGARKARDLARQVRDLRARADFLAHRPAPRGGWEFPSEAGSLGLARVLVTLSQLARLTASTIDVLFHGDEIEQLRQRAELRLSALESLHAARLRVQFPADGRPAAQRAIGGLLCDGTDLLERPTFGQAEQANLNKVLEQIEKWASPDTFGKAYQESLLDRRRSSECPLPSDLQGLSSISVQKALNGLFAGVPTEQEIQAPTTSLDALKGFDDKIAKLALLWREHDKDWVDALTTAYTAGKPLDELFHTVDTYFWGKLSTTGLALECNPVPQEKPQTYEVVEMRLRSDADGIDERRIRHHPLRVGWRIKPAGEEPRTAETDGLTFVQYFPSVGHVTVEACLRWVGPDIPIKPSLDFDVVQNPEYPEHRKHRMLRMFKTEWTEAAAIGAAALFAIVTAMGAQYDSTFGSMTQYFALFIWAAGAGTGGNLFSQLGTTSAPGGGAATLK